MSKEGCSYIVLLNLTTITVLECKMIFFTNYQMIHLQWDFSFLYSPSLLHLSPPRVDQIAGFDTCPINTFLKSLGIALRLNITI